MKHLFHCLRYHRSGVEIIKTLASQKVGIIMEQHISPPAVAGWVFPGVGLTKGLETLHPMPLVAKKVEDQEASAMDGYKAVSSGVRTESPTCSGCSPQVFGVFYQHLVQTGAFPASEWLLSGADDKGLQRARLGVAQGSIRCRT